MFRNTPIVVSQELFWTAAKVMARFFFHLEGTKATGLFGSLARNERAKDIDIAVFNKMVKGSFRYAINLEKDRDLELLSYLLSLTRTEQGELRILVGYFLKQGITIDLQVFPDRFSPEIIAEIRWKNPDPAFLRNIRSDILFWNPEKDGFEKDAALVAEIFGETAVLPQTSLRVVSGSSRAGEGTAIMVHQNGLCVALDCGANPGSGQSSKEQTERIVASLIQAAPKYVAISHFHYDHFGALPLLLKKLNEQRKPWPIVIATEITSGLIKEYLRQQDVFTSSWRSDFWSLVPAKEIVFQTGADFLELLPNQHSVPGSASILFKGAGKRNIFYTSDCYGISLPAFFPEVELLIVDSTGALKEEKRDPDIETTARQNVVAISREHLSRNPLNKVYIAMFSTQLDRAVWLYDELQAITGLPLFISGASLFRNMRIYCPRLYSDKNRHRVVLITGAWAQGEDGFVPDSALIRLSKNSDWHRQINKGDLVIISARIPIWSNHLMDQIKKMCERLNVLGGRVVVDESAPEAWSVFAERQHVHQGGHGNWPEIIEIIRKVNPKRVLPFHADEAARQKVARFCQQNNWAVVSDRDLSVLVL